MQIYTFFTSFMTWYLLMDDVNSYGYGLQVPFLEDPNTGVEMFESAEIIEYIRATYTL